MSMHLSWDTLNDYEDGTITPDARADAARHLDSCAECRHSLAQLRAMLASAAAAPRSIEPPGDAWRAIRARVEDRKLVPFPRAAQPTHHASRFRLIAAAAVLIFASSATTMLIMRRGTQQAPVAASAASGNTLALPAGLVRMERGYLKTVDELTVALNESRAKLEPSTVRAVERSLKIIDDAIAEAREALAHDPASDVLRDVLSRNYQQKVDLLRRTSARAQAT